MYSIGWQIMLCAPGTSSVPAALAASGGLVILATTDQVDAEPRPRRRGLIQTVNPIRAANPIYIPRGNVSHSLSFTRMVVCASQYAAQTMEYAAMAALDGITAAQDCVITRADGSVMRIAAAVIQEDGFECHAEANRFYAAYQLIGGALTNA